MTSARQMSSRNPPVCQSTFGFPDDSDFPPGSANCASARKPFHVRSSFWRVAFSRARECSNDSLFWSLPPKPPAPPIHRPRFTPCPSPLPPRSGLRQPPAAFHLTRPCKNAQNVEYPSNPGLSHFSTSHPQPGNLPSKKPAPQFATKFREANTFYGVTGLWRRWQRHRTSPMGNCMVGPAAKWLSSYVVLASGKPIPLFPANPTSKMLPFQRFFFEAFAPQSVSSRALWGVFSDAPALLGSKSAKRPCGTPVFARICAYWHLFLRNFFPAPNVGFRPPSGPSQATLFHPRPL